MSFTSGQTKYCTILDPARGVDLRPNFQELMHHLDEQLH